MTLETTATEISNEIAKLATEMDAILRKQYQTATASRPYGDEQLAEQMRVARNNSGTLIQALTLIEKYQAVTAKQEEEEEYSEAKDVNSDKATEERKNRPMDRMQKRETTRERASGANYSSELF